MISNLYHFSDETPMYYKEGVPLLSEEDVNNFKEIHEENDFLKITDKNIYNHLDKFIKVSFYGANERDIRDIVAHKNNDLEFYDLENIDHILNFLIYSKPLFKEILLDIFARDKKSAIKNLKSANVNIKNDFQTFTEKSKKLSSFNIGYFNSSPTEDVLEKFLKYLPSTIFVESLELGIKEKKNFSELVNIMFELKDLNLSLHSIEIIEDFFKERIDSIKELDIAELFKARELMGLSYRGGEFRREIKKELNNVLERKIVSAYKDYDNFKINFLKSYFDESVQSDELIKEKEFFEKAINESEITKKIIGAFLKKSLKENPSSIIQEEKIYTEVLRIKYDTMKLLFQKGIEYGSSYFVSMKDKINELKGVSLTKEKVIGEVGDEYDFVFKIDFTEEYKLEFGISVVLDCMVDHEGSDSNDGKSVDQGWEAVEALISELRLANKMKNQQLAKGKLVKESIRRNKI